MKDTQIKKVQFKLLERYRKRLKHLEEKRGITSNLTPKELMRMNRKAAHCTMTGIKLDHEWTTQVKPWQPSIDRIDNSRGYDIDNVRVVCYAMNNALGEFDDEVFKTLAIEYLKKQGYKVEKENKENA